MTLRTGLRQRPPSGEVDGNRRVLDEAMLSLLWGILLTYAGIGALYTAGSPVIGALLVAGGFTLGAACHWFLRKAPRDVIRIGLVSGLWAAGMCAVFWASGQPAPFDTPWLALAASAAGITLASWSALRMRRPATVPI